MSDFWLKENINKGSEMSDFWLKEIIIKGSEMEDIGIWVLNNTQDIIETYKEIIMKLDNIPDDFIEQPVIDNKD